MEPLGEQCCAFGVAGVGPGVGPLLEGGAVEPLHLRVGLRPIRPGPLVLDILAQGRGEQFGAVASAVVGEHSLNRDPNGVEIGVRPLPERCRGLLLLVFEEFAVGEPGAVVDGIVDVPVADLAALSVLLAGCTAQHLVTAAVGDPAELLDVDVDQVAWCFVDVGVRLLRRPLDPHPGRGVGPRQPRATVAEQNLVHRRDRHPQPIGNPGRPPPSADPQPDHTTLDPSRCPSRRGPRTRGSISHAVPAVLAVALDPALGRGD